uniref:Ovule protein n=1 Tax=Heterorhabditis bacteriophora TaxID=37862 RepID=A0A1I7WKU2_HETBA
MSLSFLWNLPLEQVQLSLLLNLVMEQTRSFYEHLHLCLEKKNSYTSCSHHSSLLIYFHLDRISFSQPIGSFNLWIILLNIFKMFSERKLPTATILENHGIKLVFLI